jgi:hypothetical protein
MDLARRIVARFLNSFKYEKKEKKEHKVERFMKAIRDATGISKGQAEDIADAYVRGREVNRLALQKAWPLEEFVVTGPEGTCDLRTLQ